MWRRHREWPVIDNAFHDDRGAESLYAGQGGELLVPQFLPQIFKLRTTHDTAGVSWSWAALTAINNAAWIACFTRERYWIALIPSSSAALLTTTLAAMLTIRGGRSCEHRPRSGRGR